LWAPWRIQYIERPKQQDEGCIFCDNPAKDDDQKNLILCRGNTCFVVMNRYPYNNAHLLVVPYRHIGNFAELDATERLELMNLLVDCQRILERSLSPHGYNIGMNLGKAAGAGIEQHLHFHIVPRWNGDTNFMPVIANTDVISEGLEHTWQRLRQDFSQLK
ncbi:MAG: HIT domain-containing protein, partial [bacterium]|nr:HIT domain-containing protein [bacterium]